jgi:hypothetical protein
MIYQVDFVPDTGTRFEYLVYRTIPSQQKYLDRLSVITAAEFGAGSWEFFVSPNNRAIPVQVGLIRKASEKLARRIPKRINRNVDQDGSRSTKSGRTEGAKHCDPPGMYTAQKSRLKDSCGCSISLVFLSLLVPSSLSFTCRTNILGYLVEGLL